MAFKIPKTTLTCIAIVITVIVGLYIATNYFGLPKFIKMKNMVAVCLNKLSQMKKKRNKKKYEMNILTELTKNPQKEVLFTKQLKIKLAMNVQQFATKIKNAKVSKEAKN